ncbi:MAG TPA: glutaredoxin family protein [Clostridia bacterium]|nr:glutaredoxin family protein [Clostridia bacterium]
MHVVLVTRQSCHLCDQALAMLQELSLHPDVLDVDADDELYRLYDWRVPVILADGVVVAEGRVNRDRLREALNPS